MKNLLLITILLLYITLNSAFSIEFIENRGQLRYTDGLPADDIKFYANHKGQRIYLTENSIGYELREIIKDSVNTKTEKTNKEENKNISYLINRSRTDIQFVGIEDNFNIDKKKKLKQHRNYYTKHGSYTLVPVYEEIIYKNLYDGIDLKIYTSKENELEYDYIISPKADISQIEFKLINSEGHKVQKDGDLVIKNKLGIIHQKQPYTYQTGKGKEVIKINSNYVKKTNGNYTFDVDKYDITQDLVIDPLIKVFTKDIRGNYGEEANGLAVDSKENLLITGVTNSTDLEATYPINTDIYGPPGPSNVWRINLTAKYNKDGALLWLTLNDTYEKSKGLKIAVNSKDEIIEIGMPGKVDLTDPIYEGKRTSTADIYINKIDTNGIIQKSRYAGGNDHSEGYDIKIDTEDNVIVCFYTWSNIGLPIHEEGSYNRGLSDTYILKMNSKLENIWGRYIGGDKRDIPTHLAIDKNNNIYVLIMTASTDIEVNGFQKEKIDGYGSLIYKLDEDGYTLWNTFLGGESKLHSSHGVVIGADNNAYVFISCYYEDLILDRDVDEYMEGGIILYKLSPDGEKLWLQNFRMRTNYYAPVNVLNYGENIIITGDMNIKDYEVEDLEVLDPNYKLNKTNNGGTTFVYEIDTNVNEIGYYINHPDDFNNINDAVVFNESLYMGGYFIENSSPELSIVKCTLKKTELSTNIKYKVCSGSEMDISFKQNFKPEKEDKTYTCYLSNKDGSFEDSLVIGELTTDERNGIIQTEIPIDIEAGEGYKIKVVSEDKRIYSEESDYSVTITNSPKAEILNIKDTICRYSTPFLYTETNEDYVNKWVLNGAEIVGEKNKDTLYIDWGEAKSSLVRLFQTNIKNNCEKVREYNIIIKDSTELKEKENLQICQNSEQVELEQVEPYGGTYIGNGIVDNKFNPEEVEIGKHKIVYEYDNEYGCISRKEIEIEVLAAPEIAEISQSNDTLYSSYEYYNQWYEFDDEELLSEENYYIPSEDGLYYIKREFENGCSSDFSSPYNYIKSGVLKEEYKDRIIINGRELKVVERIRTIEIYNMLGQLIYKSDGKQEIELKSKLIFIKINNNRVYPQIGNYYE